MTRIDNLAARLDELEKLGGYEILPDGSRLRVKSSGIKMLREYTRLQRDLGHDPKLKDFPEADREQWRQYAKWHPSPSMHGAISVMIADLARAIQERSA